ncbi:MAG: hypothetical protein WCK57_07665 [Verrucomicrobiae bacterium]
MATRKSTILKCDVCGKEVTDEGSGWIGGHPFSGWYSLKEHGGSTQLVELNRQKDWDICSKGCLMDFSNRAFPVHISSGKGSDIPLSEVRGILSNSD